MFEILKGNSKGLEIALNERAKDNTIKVHSFDYVGSEFICLIEKTPMVSESAAPSDKDDE